MWSGSGSTARRGSQFVVKIEPHGDNRIAARNPYNNDVKDACKAVIGSLWDPGDRCWTFPSNRLEDLKMMLQHISGLDVKVVVAPSVAMPGGGAARQHTGNDSRQHEAVASAAAGMAERREAPPPNVSRYAPGMAERVASHMDPRNRVDLRAFEHSSPLSSPKSPMKSPLQSSQGRDSQEPGGNSVVVRIHKHRDERIAARNPYKESIKEACKAVSGSMWDVTDRCWTFPANRLDDLAYALLNIPDLEIRLEALPPIVLPEAVLRQQRAGPMPHQPISPVRPQAPERPASPASPRIVPGPAVAQEGPVAPSSPGFMPQPSAMPPTLPPVYVPKIHMKFLPHSEGKIAIKFPYCERLLPVMRSFAEVEWRAAERSWSFPFEYLEELKERLQAVKDVEVILEPLHPLVIKAFEATTSATDDSAKYENIPAALETQLMDFQREGVRFALKRGGRALIADEMGLGKTVQAISICAAYREEWPVLVLVPSSLLVDWAMAIRRWLNVDASDITVVLAQSGGRNAEGFNFVQSSGKRPLKENAIDGLFNIVSYSLLDKLLEKGQLSTEFQVAIVDESHYLKNPTAKRTNAAKSVLRSAKRLILLTGTPALSRPIELLQQLHVLQPKVYHGVKEYGLRYCEGGRFGMYQGASNKEELHGLVKSTVMIRRLKKDVLKQLPQKRRQQVFLTIDDKGLRQLKALFDQRAMINAAIEIAQTEDEATNLRYKEQQLTTKLYIDSAAVKVPAVQEYVSNLLDSDVKFLIFAHHEELMNGIEQAIVKSKVAFIRIDGKTPSAQRQPAVQRFQENEDVRVALLSIRAAGVGLTLTAASTVVFAEMAWTPMDLVQAEDRAHRIGQESSVNVIYLHAKETIDDVIWDVIGNKLENLGQVLDGKEDRFHVASMSKAPLRREGREDRFEAASMPKAPVKRDPRQTTLSGFLSQSSSQPGFAAPSAPEAPTHVPIGAPARTTSPAPQSLGDMSSEVEDVVSIGEV